MAWPPITIIEKMYSQKSPQTPQNPYAKLQNHMTTLGEKLPGENREREKNRKIAM